MKFQISLPDDVKLIIDMLRDNGFSAHVVGGAVRDSLIGRELCDFDITTDASPEETKAVFSAFKTVDTGIKHGTVTVVIDHTPYEITTYRIDGDYKDRRHPESVTFTRELSEDLKRRDFTVNAMCYSPHDGLTDLFGGREDAKRGMIRAVGDPRVRFDEDALRILRALRFASVLDFEIEDKTASAARDRAQTLLDVSGERIYTELKKLIMGCAASRIMIEYASVLSVVLGGVLVEQYPTDRELAGVDLTTRISAIFLLNSSSPKESASRVLTSLKTDNFTRSGTENVLCAYDEISFSDKRSVLHALRIYGKQTIEGVLKLGLLLRRFTDNDSALFDEVMSSDPVYEIAHLKVGGRDLMALGYQGPEVGSALSELLCAVIDGRCDNTPESLKEFLAK